MLEQPLPPKVSAKPPRSPEMTSQTTTSKVQKMRRNSKKQLPPRAPVLEKKPDPPNYPTSQEDLSFGDFSNLEQPTNISSLSDHFQTSPSSFRRSKVNAVDVASVGNASDTMVQNNTATRDMHERAKLAFNKAEYDKALPMFESILTAQVQRFAPLHPAVGAAMHNVGVCRQRLGEHSTAETLFKEAISIRQECLGEDHLEVAASLSKLGAAQTALGKFDDAFVNLRKACKIAVSCCGQEHKTVAQMLCHLACLYFEAGELMASEATFQDALEIYRAVWKTQDNRDACMTQLTDTLCNVGSIQNRRKRFTAAVTSFSDALDLQRGVMSHDDARIISTLDNLGYSYSKLKDYTKALNCYRKMYRAQVSASGTFTNACLETFRKEILMYEKLGLYSDAAQECGEALKLQAQYFPNTHPISEHTQQLLDDLNHKMSL